MRTSFHHQPEAQHPKSSSYPPAGTPITPSFDAVDGSSTGTEVPWMWVLLRPPRFGGARYATGYDNRSPPRERAGALTVYVRDLHRFAPMVDKVQTELWSKPPLPAPHDSRGPAP